MSRFKPTTAAERWKPRRAKNTGRSRRRGPGAMGSHGATESFRTSPVAMNCFLETQEDQIGSKKRSRSFWFVFWERTLRELARGECWRRASCTWSVLQQSLVCQGAQTFRALLLEKTLVAAAAGLPPASKAPSWRFWLSLMLYKDYKDVSVCAPLQTQALALAREELNTAKQKFDSFLPLERSRSLVEELSGWMERETLG